ncbi:hypothetical protein NIB75_15685 [Bacteroides uniformis]|nr:hypothetical protein [Bacteroides uniformis]
MVRVLPTALSPITTKRGKTGVAEVSYDGYVGVQNLYKIPTILNAQEYMMMQDEGRVMDGLSPYNWATYIPERDLQAIQNGTWKGTNWLKEVLNEDALVQNHAVNITGGTDRSRYAIGISYTNQEATMGVPGEFHEMNRYNFRVNSDHVVMKKGNLDFHESGRNHQLQIFANTRFIRNRRHLLERSAQYAHHEPVDAPLQFRRRLLPLRRPGKGQLQMGYLQRSQ